MLTVSHVTKMYKKVKACNDVSFELEPGSINVLLGPNGAGKSTIIKSIIGFLRYAGDITVDGIPNKTTDARRLIGYIPEMPSLYPNLTVSEHMEFLARAYKLTDYKERIDSLLERFELTDKKKKFGDELSKGMQQKLNICLGLLPQPEVLLLDEPMIGLDPHAIKQLKQVMEELRAQGNTLLVSTHIIDSVDMLWDRALIMQDGCIRSNMTRDELEADGRSLEQLFFDVTEGIGAEEMAAKEEAEKEAEEKPVKASFWGKRK
jgi:ABC-2 type transport system ATP-binding protein